MNFDMQIFKNPPKEYRSAPFWAWNSKLNAAELERQIDCFKEMGFGGFHMHPRSGLDTEYLSDEFMDCVQTCINKAQETDMLAYMYDEDRWPSGFAGGLVTVNPEFRARQLILTTIPYEQFPGSGAKGPFATTAHRTGNGALIACYDIVQDENGYMTEYRVIQPDAPTKGRKWYAYAETAELSPWFNGYTNVDVLNKNAIKAFLDITHEKYYNRFGKYFGNIIPLVFTDEPFLVFRILPSEPFSDADIQLPWSDDLDDTYRNEYGDSIIPTLPEIIWDKGEQDSGEARYRFNDHIVNRFKDAFMRQYSEWCRNHNISFSGHLIEGELKWQGCTLGTDVMRMYDTMDIPGVDLLSDDIMVRYDIRFAKSVANQKGINSLLCENLGVTRWSFDFRDHLFQNDWSSAMGVTLRAPHLSMLSMAGEGKRDYPASINYQAPWYAEYKQVEDHSARVSYVLSLGKPAVRIGVINPVESFWRHGGCSARAKARQDEMDRHYKEMDDWLTFSGYSFDYISEALLPNMLKLCDGRVFVGEMSYDVIIVPDCSRLRDTTFQALKTHKQYGAKIIFTGELPIYIDGRESDAVRDFVKECETINFGRADLLEVLEPYRLLSISSGGESMDDIITNLRSDGDDLYLFAASIKKPRNRHKPAKREITFQIKGEYSASLMDTYSGIITPLATKTRNGRTSISHTLHDFNSLLLKLSSHSHEASPDICVKRESVVIDPAYIIIEPCEPNVLLLDTAEYSHSGGDWQPCEEILRLDNKIRRELKYPERLDVMTQPWTIKDESRPHTIKLRFTFNSEISVGGIQLALENLSDTVVEFNGVTVKSSPSGYYVDRSIKTINLPDIKIGVNTLILTVKYGEKTNLEWYYLLGNFGVQIIGRDKIIIEMPEKLGFGDLSTQGLPFYGGNVRYRFGVDSPGELSIRIPQYDGALVGVSEDGVRRGTVITPPYTVNLPANPAMDKSKSAMEDVSFASVSQGRGYSPQGARREIELLLFGTRHNTFSALHHAAANDPKEMVSHPNSWRTTGDLWCYEYKLSPFGILVTPEIKKI